MTFADFSKQLTKKMIQLGIVEDESTEKKPKPSVVARRRARGMTEAEYRLERWLEKKAQYDWARATGVEWDSESY